MSITGSYLFERFDLILIIAFGIAGIVGFEDVGIRRSAALSQLLCHISRKAEVVAK